jgi:hypothetical protein
MIATVHVGTEQVFKCTLYLYLILLFQIRLGNVHLKAFQAGINERRQELSVVALNLRAKNAFLLGNWDLCITLMG